MFVKASMFKGKTDSNLSTRLRLELCIDNDTHKKWLTEFTMMKKAGTLTIKAEDMAGGRRIAEASAGPASAPPAAKQNPELPDPLRHKVQFYRTPEGWLEGAVIEYNAAAKKIRVGFLNNVRKSEWLDYTPSSYLVIHPVTVSDLNQYSHS